MSFMKENIVDIELTSGNIHRSFLNHSIGRNDDDADWFGVRVFRNGEPVLLEGSSVQGFFKQPGRDPIAITSGNNISGNVAEVLLPQACYNYEGQFTLAIKLISTSEGVTGTMRIVDGMVDNTNVNGAVAPTGTIPTYQEILAVYEQMVAAKEGSVRFDITQQLTSAQQLKARNNIAGASQADMDTVNAKIGNTPLPTTAQTLTGAIAEHEGDLTDQQGQITDLKSAIKQYEDVERSFKVVNTPEYTIEQGAISSTSGSPTSSTSANFYKRLRTANYIQNEKNGYIHFNIPDGFWCDVTLFSTNATSGFEGSYSSRLRGESDIILSNNYFKLTLGLDAGGTVAPSDLPTTNPLVQFVHPTDKTLLLENIPADAKATGDGMGKRIAVSSFTGGTSAAAQPLNTACRLNSQGVTDLPSGIGAVSRACWLYTFGGTSYCSQIFMSTSASYSGMYYRVGTISDGVASYGDWTRLLTTDASDIIGYDLFPTGDDTPRGGEILDILQARGVCRLAPGDYYFGVMSCPAGSKIIGAGMYNTRLIQKDETERVYGIRLRANSSISDLTIEKYHEDGMDITPVKDYSLGTHGIRIGGLENTDTNDYECKVENVFIKNFEGCGIFNRRVGQAARGTIYSNVRVYNCSCGIYLGTNAEYNEVIGCYTCYCYYGMVVMGGNNIVSSSDMVSNEVNLGLLEVDAYGSASNDAHGIITGCKFAHAGRYSGEYPGDGTDGGYDIYAGAQSSAELIIGCFIGYPIYVKDRVQPLMIASCQIRRLCTIASDNSTIIMTDCMWQDKTSAVTVSNGGIIRRRDCLAYDGTELPDVTE